MWTTWLERTLGQRPANENEPPSAKPDRAAAPTLAPGVIMSIVEAIGDDAVEMERADKVMP